MANIYEKRIIKIYGEGDFSSTDGWSANIYTPMLTAFEHPATEAEYIAADNRDRKIITNMVGWDDSSTSVEINTEPLLLSSGSAIISKRLAERELIIEYSSKPDSPREITNIEGTIKSMMFAMEPVVVTRQTSYSDNWNNLRIEALFKCYITSFEMTRATQTDYTVKIVFKVLKPEKKIYTSTVGSNQGLGAGGTL